MLKIRRFSGWVGGFNAVSLGE